MAVDCKAPATGHAAPPSQARSSAEKPAMDGRKPNQRWWATVMYCCVSVYFLTEVVRVGGFWNSYVADIVGPAWAYIYMRGLVAKEQPTAIGRTFFLPELGALAVVSICVFAEFGQYFHLYDRTYDPYDFVAYGSLLLPCYFVDRWLFNGGGAQDGEEIHSHSRIESRWKAG